MIPVRAIVRLLPHIVPMSDDTVPEQVEMFRFDHGLDDQDTSTVWRLRSGEAVDDPDRLIRAGTLWLAADHGPTPQEIIDDAAAWVHAVTRRSSAEAELIVLGVRAILSGQPIPRRPINTDPGQTK